MAKVRINQQVIEQQVYERVEEGLQEAAKEIVRVAKSLAPVRKLEKYQRTGGRRKPRLADDNVVGIFDKSTGRQLSKSQVSRLFTSGKTGAQLQGHLSAMSPSATYGKNGKLTGYESSSEITARGIAKTLASAGYEFRLVGDNYKRSKAAEREVSLGNFHIDSIDAVGKSGKMSLGKITYGGHLRRSIKSASVTRDGGKIRTSIAATASYAKYVEFGTRHAKAQPFLLPAIHSVADKIPAMIKKK